MKPSHTNSDQIIIIYLGHAIPKPNTSQAYINIQIKGINTMQHPFSLSQNIGIIETNKKKYSPPLHLSYT